MAAAEETCLSIATGVHHQSCQTYKVSLTDGNLFPKLETTLAINKSMSPFKELLAVKSKDKGKAKETINNQEMISNLDVSPLKPETPIRLTSPDCRLRVVRPLSAKHLLLEQDTRAEMKPPADPFDGHRELFDELDVHGIPKILVHIQASDLTHYKPQNHVQVESTNGSHKNFDLVLPSQKRSLSGFFVGW